MNGFPRWSLAVLSLLTALIFGWAAFALPWRELSTFAIGAMCVAVGYGATAVLAFAGHRWRVTAWRIAACLALGFLVWLSWNLVSASVYIASLYGGLGQGVAAALAGVWAIAVLLTVPLAVWGLVVTGGVNLRRLWIGVGVLVVAAAIGLVMSMSAAQASTRVHGPLSEIDSAVARAVSDAGKRPAAHRRGSPTSLYTASPAVCGPDSGSGQLDVLVTYPRRDTGAIAHVCVSTASVVELVGPVAAELARARRGPIKVDVIIGRHDLQPLGVLADPLLLRPGLDGVCWEQRCLAPWQLVALDAFRTLKPITSIPDLKFGVDPLAVRRLLGAPEVASLEGLTRIETRSLLIDTHDRVRPLRHLRGPRPEVTVASLRRAGALAEQHVFAAQQPDGRLRPAFNLFTGKTYGGFSIQRQAGILMTLCEQGKGGATRDNTARRGLQALADLEERIEDFGVLVLPDNQHPKVGWMALPLAAFAACRKYVGPQFDPLIGRLTRAIVRGQGSDGGFFERIERRSGRPYGTREILYSGGQAVLGLAMVEAIVAAEPDAPGLPALQVVHDAAERAMDYYAGPYWDHIGRDFFYIEENWHCLAARAALEVHRHPGYEQFCLDYVEMKKRLVLTEDTGVDPGFIGAFGFGRVIVPHTTPSAGFGEALAASMAIKARDGVDLTADKRLLTDVIGYILHHQWDPDHCFACSPKQAGVGGWTEHVATSFARIDYVQHTWSAFGHGGRLLFDAL